jgi:hypothetical protein
MQYLFQLDHMNKGRNIISDSIGSETMEQPGWWF